ncbi:MAG TPA: hypothetical protein H9809_08545 [Candidatus Blautia pullicola]|uniref:Uncharacterized protein n=1 Tax=Candidatus Blautia pullicola TaxID=2838498 RepID=A0A9D2FSG1_9FIRM|nr:hypothetical protein [Candidatus Blautia pullicola]
MATTSVCKIEIADVKKDIYTPKTVIGSLFLYGTQKKLPIGQQSAQSYAVPFPFLIIFYNNVPGLLLFSPAPPESAAINTCYSQAARQLRFSSQEIVFFFPQNAASQKNPARAIHAQLLPIQQLHPHKNP